MNQRPTATVIPVSLSLYLDLVRFLAAVSVLLYHTWGMLFPTSTIKWPGHEAVVVFFVLSGYVIAHSVSSPSATLSSYVQHRIARIIPVAYAALLLSILICVLIPWINNVELLWPTVANMLFMAQSGPFSINAPLNPPFWSLNYEVWYYILFGIWTFAPARYRALLIIVATIIAGPKILMLMPVWIFGVILYRTMPPLKLQTAWFFLLASALAFSFMTWLNVSDLLRAWFYANVPGAWRSMYSSQFLYDTLLGLVVMLHLTAIASMQPVLSNLARIQRPIRYMANCTFSLYVFHGPLLEVFIHTPFLKENPWIFYGVMGACIIILAELTEQRVKFYRGIVASIAGYLKCIKITSQEKLDQPSVGP